mmetsp:Transcript_18372/g.27554  ORF Transcript_18372/g.27554 Transcript_18372/m.27554 type:complete len:197 (-) Transcript_18372:46-636(-)
MNSNDNRSETNLPAALQRNVSFNYNNVDSGGTSSSASMGGMNMNMNMTMGMDQQQQRSAATQSATMTIAPAASAASAGGATIGNMTANEEDIVLPLTLRGRPRVTWDENVEDNEGLGRKSSKRCCIFHKERDFGESSTDSSDDDESDNDSESSSSSGGGFSTRKKKHHSHKGKKKERRRIARPKQPKVPNFQRYHA